MYIFTSIILYLFVGIFGFRIFHKYSGREFYDEEQAFICVILWPILLLVLIAASVGKILMFLCNQKR